MNRTRPCLSRSKAKSNAFPPVYALIVAAACFISTVGAAHALTPESPEVKAVAGKAVKFLETASYARWEPQAGAKALVGMCILKHYGAKARTHPKVVDAVASVRKALDEYRKGPQESQIYNIGICMIFLLDLDTEGSSDYRGEYRNELEGFLSILLTAQKPHGGFGYPGRETGDTSMTQYGALGLWSSQVAGLTVPIDNWERLANWLLRTQDPSGGYGYQGKDPGSFNLVAQTEVRQSLTAAGLASLAICADTLRMFAPEPEESKGPALLKRVAKPAPSLTQNVDPQMVTDNLRRGQGWFGSNYTPDYKVTPDYWTPYYMYAFERYKSFAALLPPRGKDDNKWYDDGYHYLAKTQDADGSWKANEFDLTTPNTAFAVLFLYRSTQKIIQRTKTFGGGLLVGGRGLPENASDLELRAGGLRAKALKGPAMDLLQKLADPNDPKFEEAVRGMEEQSLVEEGDTMTEMQKRLRKMAEGKSPEARAAALRLLGRTRDLDNVPLLIESLRDEDPQITVAATDALRFISRKFSPAGQYVGENIDARAEAIKFWKAWYREVRPDARFDDE